MPLVPKKDLDQILDDREKDFLRQFADNEMMKNAVKKVLLFGIYGAGTLRKGQKPDPFLNFALVMVSNRKATNTPMTNEELGADLRSCWEAINELEMGFSRIEMYRSEEIKAQEKSNPAR